MVFTARVVAGSVIAIGVALTLHFLFRKSGKKKDKPKDAGKGEGDHTEINESKEHESKTQQTTDHNNAKLHGKRKHPYDEFTNLDVQSPKKPHETENKSSEVKDNEEVFQSFRKELQDFLNEDIKSRNENTNQNAETDDRQEKDVAGGNGKETENVTREIQEIEIQEIIINEEAGETQKAESATLQTATPIRNIDSSEKSNNSPKQNGIHSNGNSMEDESYKKYSEEEITDALLVSQTSPGLLSDANAEVLSALLTHPDPKLKETTLNGINRCSTFTRNQNLFREHGCLSRLSDLLYQQIMSKSANSKIVTSIANAITNLSANEENQKKLEDCVSALVDITLEDETGESVCLSSLQALTNLSITNQHHGHYTRVVQKLYNLVETGSPGIRLQAAKVLVNLSCNPELVPNMLAAKAPSCLTDLLKTATDEDLLLRWTTLLANVLWTAKEQKITAASLPPDDKAPSPETMFMALYGQHAGQLKSKVYLLTRHKNENISHQASKAYQVLT